MDLAHWIWLATAAYGVHAFEEFELDWRNWARAVIGLPVEWHDFYVVNFLVIVLGIVAAELAPASPGLALTFPALMLINAVFFHIAPFFWTRGRFSPGLITAILLFLPIGAACFAVANDSGALNTGTLALSFALAALLMAMPIILLHIKSKAYFRQDHP
ncbi:MAG: HXXEE domain-containing protein [Hyphomicrobium sp.]|uniref:HXXEE domain-containing protein n=1 Tax=Hyphomicrobium sp. TaxID=82 RepID=UPI0039E47C9D